MDDQNQGESDQPIDESHNLFIYSFETSRSPLTNTPDNPDNDQRVLMK